MLIQFKFNFVQQCIQISTRINSTSVHTYICVCFIRNVSSIRIYILIDPIFNRKEYPNYVNLFCSFLLSFSETYKPNNFQGEIKMQTFQRMKTSIQQNILINYFNDPKVVGNYIKILNLGFFGHCSLTIK